MTNPIYCSTSTLAQANGGRWFELDTALDVLPQVQCDGFEFCIFAEWERGQLLDGQAIRAYNFEEVAERVCKHAQYFKAVHANKEIAYQYLVSADVELHRQGLMYLEQAVELASICNARYVVLHGWDMTNALESYRQVMDLIRPFAERKLNGKRSTPLSIETIPGPINSAFCAEIVALLPAGWGLTLDLFHTRERAEFEDWLQLARYFTNVHVQCYIDVNEQIEAI